MPLSEITRNKENYLVYLISLIAFVMWDFYFGDYKSGFRILELIVAPILVSYLLLRKIQNRTLDNLLVPNHIITFAFCSIIFISITSGLIANFATNIKPILGISLGLCLYFLINYSSDFKTKTVNKALEVTILIVSMCLIVQWSVYVAFDYFLNFHIFLSESPRVFSSIFRPSGIFLEPGNHSVSMLMLLLAYWKNNFSFNFFSILGIISILLSLSLFGYLALILTLLYFFRSKIRYIFQGLLVLPLIIFLILTLLNIDSLNFIYERIIGATSDSSFLGRFSGFINPSGLNIFELFLGRGFSNSYIDFGNNGYAFLISGMGLLGLFIFFLFFILQSDKGNRLYTFFSLSLLLISSPIITTMFFWYWLAIITNSEKK